MMDLEALRRRIEILEKIEWDLTPQEAIERFSLKSRTSDRRSKVSDPKEKHYYFCVDNWGDHPRLVLKERSLKQSRSVAQVDAPPHLVMASVRDHGGGKGVFALNEALYKWLQDRLQH